MWPFFLVCACRDTILTPSLPQPVTFPGWKAHTCKLANSTFDDPITNLLLILCILIEVLLGARAKWGVSFSDFKFGTFIGCFPIDTLASMAVKRLNWIEHWHHARKKGTQQRPELITMTVTWRASNTRSNTNIMHIKKGRNRDLNCLQWLSPAVQVIQGPQIPPG